MNTEDIRAAIFDMDGLLVDSERMGIMEGIRISEEMGTPVTETFMCSLLGITMEKSRQLFADDYPCIDYDVYRQYFNDRMQRAGETGAIHAMPGAHALLKRLRGMGIPCAVASSSPLQRVQAFLKSAGLNEYFTTITHGDLHLPSKPAPDIFLKAAEMLHAEPACCMALEDSPNGLRAARAAGMRVVMVPDLIPYSDSLSACCDAVARSLDEVSEWFSRR